MKFHDIQWIILDDKPNNRYLYAFVMRSKWRTAFHSLTSIETVSVGIDLSSVRCQAWAHDDVIKWKHFPRYWPFVRGIHRPPVNSPHKGQWRGALMFSLICVWINVWVNNREAGDLRRYRDHYDVILIQCLVTVNCCIWNQNTNIFSKDSAREYVGNNFTWKCVTRPRRVKCNWVSY